MTAQDIFSAPVHFERKQSSHPYPETALSNVFLFVLKAVAYARSFVVPNLVLEFGNQRSIQPHSF